MSVETLFLLLAAFLFALMVFLALHGHSHARRRWIAGGTTEGRGASEVETTIFAIFGLLLAFTFTTAYSRFEENRVVVVDEANAIWTTYRRADLLPADIQAPIKAKLKSYVEWRMSFWRDLPNQTRASADIGKARDILGEVWALAVSARIESEATKELVLEAIGAMSATSMKRVTTIAAHPPLHIYGVLYLLSLLTAWFAGYAMASLSRPSVPHILALSAISSIMLYVILDLEYPRYGLIRLATAEGVLVDLLGRM